jgi:nucleoside-diphosphate-sugar epimerase
MTRLLLTGYSGFIGQALASRLSSAGYQLTAVTKKPVSHGPNASLNKDIGPATHWEDALDGIECVVHLAARVHVKQEADANALDAFRLVNTEGTLKLAKSAASAGVRRFLYMSTIKVNGDRTDNFAFTENDDPAPTDSYARSKLEAEVGLHQIANATGMGVIIIRPPLVYGPGVKANFFNLLRLVDTGIPLPFAGVENQRSLLALDNLCDFVLHALWHRAAVGETFLLSDGEDISTPELIRRLALCMGRKARLFTFPQRLLRITARAMRKQDAVDRLFYSLQIDSQKSRQLLGWAPPITLDEGFRQTVDWYLAGQR